MCLNLKTFVKMVKLLSLAANLGYIPRVQKPGPRPMALAFQKLRPGQSPSQAKGQAWLLASGQSQHITNDNGCCVTHVDNDNDNGCRVTHVIDNNDNSFAGSLTSTTTTTTACRTSPTSSTTTVAASPMSTTMTNNGLPRHPRQQRQ